MYMYILPPRPPPFYGQSFKWWKGEERQLVKSVGIFQVEFFWVEIFGKDEFSWGESDGWKFSGWEFSRWKFS